MPSASINKAPTTPQNSNRVCHSRPVLAKRDASMHNTAPTVPSQTALNKRSKPDRSVPLAVHPRSSSITSTSTHPSWRARSTQRVLQPLTFQIVSDLARRRLPDIDAGLSSQMISAYLIHRQPPLLSSRVLSTNLSVHRPLAELPPSVAGAREPRCCLRIVVLALSLVGASRPPSDSLPPREDRQVVVRRRSSRSAVRAGRGAWVISISAAEESVIHTGKRHRQPVLTSDDVASLIMHVVQPNYGKAFAGKRMKSVSDCYRGRIVLMGSMSSSCSNGSSSTYASKCSSARRKTLLNRKSGSPYQFMSSSPSFENG